MLSGLLSINMQARTYVLVQSKMEEVLKMCFGSVNLVTRTYFHL